MRIHDIDFGSCWDAAGVRGFSGEGYWFHHLPLIKRWFNFTGSTRVAKTTTLNKQEGNLKQNQWFPQCIWLSWIHGIVLNAVDLTGPGAEYLFKHGLLNSTSPFMISFIPVMETREDRIAEFKEFVKMLGEYSTKCKHKPEIALQINLSCPNTKYRPSDFVLEARDMMNCAYRLGIPLIIKVDLSLSIECVRLIANYNACSAICCTNSIRFGTARIGDLEGKIDWYKWFGEKSPLAKFGGGGLSGKPLFPLVVEWVHKVRAAGINIPLNVGGGIMKSSDVDALVEAGLRPGIDSIFIGTVAILRPWRIRAIINRAHKLLD